MNTSIKNAVDHVGRKAQYDAKVKSLLVHKEVLAWILTRATDEFRGMAPKDVVPLIEGEPVIGQTPIDPGITNKEKGTRSDGSKITGINTENSEDSEGVIHFDILFKVWASSGLTQIIIDLEPQKDIPTEYKLLNRGFFYISRLISSQKNRDFSGKNYDDIKRVYTIFICMNRKENTLSRFFMNEERILGNAHWQGDRNMLNLVMIGLAKEIPPHDPEYELHRLLATMLSETVPAREKLDIMENEYQIKMEEDYQKEVTEMGGFGQAIWEDGVREGMREGKAEGKDSILTLMQKLFAAGRVADAEKASNDMEYCDKLLSEYGLAK